MILWFDFWDNRVLVPTDIRSYIVFIMEDVFDMTRYRRKHGENPNPTHLELERDNPPVRSRNAERRFGVWESEAKIETNFGALTHNLFGEVKVYNNPSRTG